MIGRTVILDIGILPCLCWVCVLNLSFSFLSGFYERMVAVCCLVGKSYGILIGVDAGVSR